MRVAVAVLMCAVSAGVALAKEKPKLPSAEEGGSRAASQDLIGNLCPGVLPNYTMKLVLIAALKDKNPSGWAKGYNSAMREMLELTAKPGDLATVCENALQLYGPNGSWVPNLLVERK